MLDVGLKVLDLINEKGYMAYLVGGYVRDYILGIKSNDIDICTNATPKELLEIFEGAKIPREDYGAVTIIYKDIRFEITTFRREFKYSNNRKPCEIEYISSLDLDILRRDFTINTICMDKDKNIIDLLDGRKDIEDKIIRTVGDSNRKFSEDALRILRAVRFATKLNFKLDEEVILAIKNNKHLLKNISYERKKEELDKIFTNSNNKEGIKLLCELELYNVLEIPDIVNLNYTDSLIGIWAIIDKGVYHFSNNEKELIEDIREALNFDNLEPKNLYNKGLYVNSVAASIKGISNTLVTKAYNDLAIHSRHDIAISASDILEAIGKKEGIYLKEIFIDLENVILYKIVENDRDELLKYCVDKYA